ncbi:hypothetical protein [Streptococcus acidominimus]|uniref:Uncharacterized protein n=1 Tax=Streptococcus acidominimus TaxID=1326 RepID=A0A4Y9FP81_STRAI|nr:hypothetical protein [Streptococcus acidominimus]MBF0819115.1 hypothetical protein [Streptococcus acidominimus]MBF0839735.1 hypothetical protein [Streptococcus acidominimus]MBF0846938.1 hypothetical protein [Streptococcus danieliae]TFU30343.1 hypothetical protein E4U01_06645 [Streptococcus acidominimus]
MRYETFKQLLSYGEEFEIVYKNQQYYISQNILKSEIYFTITPEVYYVFKNYNKLLEAPLIENKTLLEQWQELKIY